ncbi:MAG: cell division protein FtsA [bacterium]
MFDLKESFKKNIIASLDIGTHKICAVIAEMDEKETLHILGAGISSSQGLRQGVVVNLDAAVESIKKAVHEAQLTAGVKIDDVIVGIAGEHIKSFNSRGMVAVSKSGSEIIQDDVEKVLNAAKAIALPKDRTVLHRIPQEYIVDNQDGIDNPVGIKGVRLEAEIHIVTCSETSVQNIASSVKRAGLRPISFVLESLASSYAVLDKNEKDLGVAMIDLGGGTTDLIIFCNGTIRHTAVISMGGKNVTKDIALELKTPLEEAEDLKSRFGSCYKNSISRTEYFTVPGIGGRPPREERREELAKIIQPRMEELFSLASKEIKRSDYGDQIGAGVVLTGGASLLEGCSELAEEIFGVPVKIGIPIGVRGLEETINSPVFATGIGLILYKAQKQDEKFEELEDMENLGVKGLFRKVRRFLHENF